MKNTFFTFHTNLQTVKKTCTLNKLNKPVLEYSEKGPKRLLNDPDNYNWLVQLPINMLYNEQSE